MIIRKIITVLKMVEITFKGVKIENSIHNNIEKNVKMYNHGKKIKIGNYFYARSNVSINTEDKGKITIGDNVFINRNSIISCRDCIQIKDGCIIGPNVCIYDHDHTFGKNGVEEGYKSEEVVIEENCWIGAGAIILKGTHIGKNSVIAAGTVLKGTYQENSMIYNTRETVVKTLE